MLSGLAPRRRRLVEVAVALTVVIAVVIVGLIVRGGSATPTGPAISADAPPGPVVLVPGYGGGQTSLDALARQLVSAGRSATVVSLPDGGTGDLVVQARTLASTVSSVLHRTGATYVDLVGYSAGGIVSRLYIQEMHGYSRVRRLITLGTPDHGTNLAAGASALVPGACTGACAQLVPGSALLAALNARPLTPGPPIISVFTEDDQTVTPPTSAVLAGATVIDLQHVCSDEQVSHGGLPTDPLVTGIVLRELGAAPVSAPSAADCVALRSAG